MNEGCKAPLRGDARLAIPEHPLGRRAEYGDVIGKRATDFAEKVSALRQDVIAVPIGQPIEIGRRAMHNLLQTHNIWRGLMQVGDQRLAQFAAPTV